MRGAAYGIPEKFLLVNGQDLVLSGYIVSLGGVFFLGLGPDLAGMRSSGKQSEEANPETHSPP